MNNQWGPSGEVWVRPTQPVVRADMCKYAVETDDHRSPSTRRPSRVVSSSARGMGPSRIPRAPGLSYQICFYRELAAFPNIGLLSDEIGPLIPGEVASRLGACLIDPGGGQGPQPH